MLLPIALIVLVDVLALTIIIPLLPFYAQTLGATPTTVGLLMTVFAACQLISGPILGQLSDKYGRRPLLLVSQVGTFLGLLLLAYSDQLWMIFLSRILDGVTAGNLSIAQAYIADVTKPEDRAKSFAIIGIAFGSGFLVGPGISGYLSQYGYHAPALAAAGASLISIMTTFFFLPQTEPLVGKRLKLTDPKTYTQFFHRKELAPLLWQFFLFSCAFGMFHGGFAMFAERRFSWEGKAFGPKEVGYVLAYVGLLGIILQGGFIGRMVKKWGEVPLVISGFVVMAFSYATLGVTSDVRGLLVVMVFSAYGTGVLRPTLSSLITKHVHRDEQGVVLGLTQSLGSIAQMMTPLLAGALIEANQLTLWSWCGGLFAIAAVLIVRGPTSLLLRK